MNEEGQKGKVAWCCERDTESTSKEWLAFAVDDSEGRSDHDSDFEEHEEPLKMKIMSTFYYARASDCRTASA